MSISCMYVVRMGDGAVGLEDSWLIPSRSKRFFYFSRTCGLALGPTLLFIGYWESSGQCMKLTTAVPVLMVSQTKWHCVTSCVRSVVPQRQVSWNASWCMVFPLVQASVFMGSSKLCAYCSRYQPREQSDHQLYGATVSPWHETWHSQLAWLWQLQSHRRWRGWRWTKQPQVSDSFLARVFVHCLSTWHFRNKKMLEAEMGKQMA